MRCELVDQMFLKILLFCIHKDNFSESADVVESIFDLYFYQNIFLSSLSIIDHQTIEVDDLSQ